MNTIKYPYRVKFDGKYYPPNTDIPVRKADSTDEIGAVVEIAAAPEKSARKKTAKSRVDE